MVSSKVPCEPSFKDSNPAIQDRRGVFMSTVQKEQYWTWLLKDLGKTQYKNQEKALKSPSRAISSTEDTSKQ